MEVWKFPVKVADYFTIAMPAGAQPLCVQMQGDDPMMWALVNPDEPTIIQRKFRFAGTGHRITDEPRRLSYISTFQAHGGALIFHIFEVLPN